MRTEFIGNIQVVRHVEDCIRQTERYTKGLLSRPQEHPIQGADFPSSVLTEHYEVYPFDDINWDMPPDTLVEFLFGLLVRIKVLFKYDYRGNRGCMTVYGGADAVDDLVKGIPGLQKALSMLTTHPERASVLAAPAPGRVR